MSKLRAVIRHEYLTIVRQPSFWIVMLAVPAIIAIVAILLNFNASSSASRVEQITNDLDNVVVIDQSGLLNTNVAQQAGITISPENQKEALVEEVRTNKRDALIVYPANLTTTRKVDIYLPSQDFAVSSSVSSLADSLLQTSLFLPLGSAEVVALAQSGTNATITIYEDGQRSAGINGQIVPGLFVVLFYIIFAFSVGYMLTSVSEEKENRSMEMVLTYVKPRTLIVGKLLAVTLVTLTQVAFFAVMALVAILILQRTSSFTLPFGVDLTALVFNPVAIFFAISYLVVGFLMYAGFMTATAAAAPSARQANSFSTVFFIGAFIPFYFIDTFLTDPDNAVVRFLTYFPLSSPVSSLICNTLDTLSLGEAITALVVMIGFMILSIWVAIRAFKLGALEFSQTIKLSSLFKR